MQVDRSIGPIGQRVVDFELLLQAMHEIDRGHSGDFQANCVGLSLVFYLLGDLFHEIVSFLFVEIEFAVARNAERRRGNHFTAAKEFADLQVHDACQRDKVLPAIAVGQPQKAR